MTKNHEKVSRSVLNRVLLYVGLLTTLLAFGAPFGGLIELPISFLLKNKLNLSAEQVSYFRLLASVPLYLSFVFGFVRDVINPFGMRDRGFVIIFGISGAFLYAYFAFAQVTYLTLLVADILITTSFLFLVGAQTGLASFLGRRYVMSGQVSTLLSIFDQLPVGVSLIIGGSLSDLLEGRSADQATRILFITGSCVMALLAMYGFWKPTFVFSNGHDYVSQLPPLAAVRKLRRHWPVYPALLIWLLWNFAPGTVTALQFYLQNTLHAKDAEWGEWNAIYLTSYTPTFILFGYLCQRFSLFKLLLWGTIIAIPQMTPLLLIHSVSGALIVAIPIGLLGGIAGAAYLDLIIRSCPDSMQGTTLMMSTSLGYVASRFGDVLGTSLYERFGGFLACVVAITIVYTAILPVILLVPKQLISTADGQTSIAEL